MPHEILKALNETDDQGNNPNIVYFDKQVIADVHKSTCGFKEEYDLLKEWRLNYPVVRDLQLIL